MKKEIKIYLDSIHESFTRAVKGAGHPCESFISINGLKIKLCFAGRAVYPCIMPAFDHLICEAADKTTFTVNIWDSRSTGIVLPDSPWSGDMSQITDKILMFNQDPVHMLYNPASKVYSLVNTETRTAYYHVPDAGLIPYYERGSPLRMILHWCLEQNGIHLIHSASVGTGGKGVLLIGRGRSGKSTTSLISLINGLDFIGDDYIAVSKNPHPLALSIYNSVEVNSDMLDKIPELQDQVINPERTGPEKALIFLNRSFSKNIVRQLRIKAIVMPVVSGKSTSRIYNIPSMKAFTELASSTIFQMPGSGKALLGGLKHIVDDLPVFAMDLSNDFSEITDTLRMFIGSLK